MERQLITLFRIIETDAYGMGGRRAGCDIGVSALSQQMSRLENELAIRLLQRITRQRNANQRRAGLFIHRRSSPCVMPTTRFSPPGSAPFRHHMAGIASTASILGIPFIHAVRENYVIIPTACGAESFVQ